MANGIAKVNIKTPQFILRPFHYPIRGSALIGLQASPTSKALKVVLRARQNKSPSRNLNQKAPQKQFHLWKRKSTAGSGKRSRALVETVMKLPNDKCSVYGALDEWVAWEEEFPLIVLTKALGTLKQRCQWKRIIQVAKWMLSKGQGMTMGTYDTMILAFDMEGRVDEAQALWDIVSLKHSRSTPKNLFSRMISMYEKHNMPRRLLEVAAALEISRDRFMTLMREGQLLIHKEDIVSCQYFSMHKDMLRQRELDSLNQFIKDMHLEDRRLPGPNTQS